MRKFENLLLLVILFASMIVRNEAIPGGWTPIKNLKDPHVQQIANFAVIEYDKQSGANLKLVNVIRGDTQVVAGISYRLVLAASNGPSTGKYQAVVLEKAGLQDKKLISFTSLYD
ncbi:hypothetical protein VNO77_25341 [Canavalia gladiata]|uniref:Cystatin domain-containing protein n=1 Tax=Canavalia gladiata TaxID=3824 RepID=A0AAN9QDG2_CANGL